MFDHLVNQLEEEYSCIIGKMSQDRLDIIVMGATGFTGSYTVKALINSAKQEKISWGVAGRNLTKLRQLLNDLSKEGDSVLNIPVFVADIEDEVSLINMTMKAKAVINCCGPYRFYGEPVVKCCIRTKTHYLDVSGEPQFMEEMQLHYNDLAANNGVYAVSACGMSGILADLGLFHFVKTFNGTVNDIEIYIGFEATGKIGSPIHDATLASAAHGYVHRSELRNIRMNLFPKPLPKLQPQISKRFLLHKNKVLNSWGFPFAGADQSVMRRSQYLLYSLKNLRPIQTKVYFTVPSFLFSILIMAIAGVSFFMLMFGSFGRNLLLKYSKLFTCGFVSREGPTEEEANNIILSLTFFGNGWDHKYVTTDFSERTNKSMKMKWSAKNPGYGFTCYTIIQGAMTMINEWKLMPGKGGVFPPGYAFAKTSMVDKMQKYAGLQIEYFK